MPANPLTWATEAMAPMLVQHGTVDRLVPYQQSVSFVEGLQAMGLAHKVTFVPVQNADHEDKLFTTDENIECVNRFLQAQLANCGR